MDGVVNNDRILSTDSILEKLCIPIAMIIKINIPTMTLENCVIFLAFRLILLFVFRNGENLKNVKLYSDSERVCKTFVKMAPNAQWGLTAQKQEELIKLYKKNIKRNDKQR